MSVMSSAVRSASRPSSSKAASAKTEKSAKVAPPRNVLLLGPDGEAKAALLDVWRQDGRIDMAAPSLGLRVGRMKETGQILFTLNGLEAGKLVRDLCKQLSTIVYVLDATDESELARGRGELADTVAALESLGCRLVVVASQMFIEGKPQFSSKTIEDHLELHKYSQPWKVHTINVNSSQGMTSLFQRICDVEPQTTSTPSRSPAIPRKEFTARVGDRSATLLMSHRKPDSVNSGSRTKAMKEAVKASKRPAANFLLSFL
eukprot:gnl/TRDRNA2_/TRDRNA2_134588_c0_seq1.p1 gnl/TRDRNA2_/TRDRNA2_134588_c0~~gnl/TRDRNA2_/TRDRNA2_134588_c0_seq1.p1  ORF type:complete len:260 (+),score=45.48 gnl/TRDRNA2_/TRDRNA2_134588_c0_seq1:96-875(+)